MNKDAIATVKTQLERDIAHGNPHWNISKETAVFLCTLLKASKPRRVLEIGTSTGYSAICMAETLASWDGTLVTVESHAGRFAIAKQHIADTGLANITQVHGHAPEIFPSIPGSFDVCFFDATKYEHGSYFDAIKERLSLGGIIIADNVLSHKDDMAPYKNTVAADPRFESYIEEIGTGLMISRKQA